MKRFTFFLILAFACANAVYSQSNNEVFAEAGHGIRSSTCRLQNAALDKTSLKHIHDDPNCEILGIPETPDLEKFTLITYQMGGDCRIDGDATPTLDHKIRVFTVHLSNYSGRCRAGGSFVGWLLVDKIPDDMKLEFVETKLDSRLDSPFDILKLQKGATSISTAEFRNAIEAKEYDLKGCIQLDMRDKVLVSSETEYLSKIRKDAQSESCKELIGSLDFEKFAYIGVNLNTGYCRRPDGLTLRVSDFGGSRKYIANIGYAEKTGGTCRALSSYDLWIRIPNSGADYSLAVRTHSYKESQYTLD